MHAGESCMFKVFVLWYILFCFVFVNIYSYFSGKVQVCIKIDFFFKYRKSCSCQNTKIYRIYSHTFSVSHLGIQVHIYDLYEYQAPGQALGLTVKTGLIIELPKKTTEVWLVKIDNKPQSTVVFIDAGNYVGGARSYWHVQGWACRRGQIYLL